MIKDLFYAPQIYAQALECGRKLLEKENADRESSTVEHQINTRIYNNAFCGLLRFGYYYEIEKNEAGDPVMMQMEIGGVVYRCPYKSAQTILRNEFESVLNSEPKVQNKETAERKPNFKENGKNKENAVNNRKNRQDQPAAKKDVQTAVPKINADAKQKETAVDATQTVFEKTMGERIIPTTPLPMNVKKDRSPAENKEQEKDIPKAAVEAVNMDEKQNTEQAVLQQDPENKAPVLDKLTEPTNNSDHMDENPEMTPDISDEVEKDSIDQPLEEYQNVPAVDVPEGTALKVDVIKSELETDSKETSEENTAKQEEPAAADEEDKEDEVDYSPLDPPEVEDEPSADSEALKTEEDAQQELGNDTEPEDLFQPKKPESEPVAPDPSIAKPDSFAETSQKTITKSEEKRGGFFEKIFGKNRSHEEKKEVVEEDIPEFQPNTQAMPTDHDDQKPEMHEASKTSPLPVEDNFSKTEDDTPEDTYVMEKHAGQQEPDILDLGSEVSDEPEAPAYDYSQDGGELFQHIHNVIVKPKFGDAVLSQVRFIIWPTRVIEHYPGQAFADILVHVTDKDGVEHVYCTDGTQKQIRIITSDKKEFNVYGIWDNEQFCSYVTLAGRTESQNRMEETTQEIVPEGTVTDAFLDQFRLERKNQPGHFVVPFKNQNCGELNIPIIGYVELKGKKYPLERREGNMLRYRYNANEKIIRGHWEKGSFQFGLEDATKIDWGSETEEE